MNVAHLCFLLLSVALSNGHSMGGMSALKRMLAKNRELNEHADKIHVKRPLSGNFRGKDQLSLKNVVKESSGDVLDRALHKVMDNMDDQSKEFLEKVGEKVIEEQRKVYIKSNGQNLLDDAAEKIGDKIMNHHEDLSDGHDLNPILDLIQSDTSDISDKREYSRKKREVDHLLNQLGKAENGARNFDFPKMANDVKTGNKFNHLLIKNKHEMKRDTGEDSADNSEITMDDLVNVLEMTRDLVPDELAAAAQGALAMGKHLGFRVRAEVEPLASAGYREVATSARNAATTVVNTSPKEAFKILSDMVSQQTIDNLATTGDMAMDGANIVAKWGARVGKKFATTSAGLLSKAGGQMAVGGANLLVNTLSRLQSEATDVEAQLEKVASDFAREASTEYVPKLVPVLQDLVVDLQDTLELAGQFFVTDIQPILEKSAEPAYDAVVEPVYDAVVEPVYDAVVEPAYDAVEPTFDTVAEYVKPAYERLRPVVKEARKEATIALLDAGLEARRVYDEAVKPTLGEISHQARPALKKLASNVADSAVRVGKTLQDDIAPPVAEGLKQTLHTVFTKMPSLVQQLSHEAHDAAKVFRKGYDKAFNDINDINQREDLEILHKASNKRKEEQSRNVNKYNRKDLDHSTEVDVPSNDLKEILNNFDKNHITRPGQLEPTENLTNRDL